MKRHPSGWSLEGRVALVTGATSGIGAQLSLQLATLGAAVGLVARDEQHGRRQVKELQSVPGAGTVTLFLCDLARQSEVHRLAKEVEATYPGGVHTLVNNAGVLNLRRAHTVDGVEETWAVNVLAPYLLTSLLLPSLRRAASATGDARVVNVGSDAHKWCRDLSLEDPGFDKLPFTGPLVYAHSKRALLHLTYAFAAELHAEGVEHITVNCIHPGTVSTSLASNAGWWAPPFKAALSVFMRSPQDGARGVLALCADPALAKRSGRYYVDKGAGREATETQTAPATLDAALSATVLALCAQMAGNARQPVLISPPSSPAPSGAAPASAEVLAAGAKASADMSAPILSSVVSVPPAMPVEAAREENVQAEPPAAMSAAAHARARAAEAAAAAAAAAEKAAQMAAAAKAAIPARQLALQAEREREREASEAAAEAAALQAAQEAAEALRRKEQMELDG